MARIAPLVGGLVLMLVVVLVVLTGAACTQPAPDEDKPRTSCKVDADCGRGKYCSEANICRSDCEIDAHCYGPTTTAQCNAQGRCIETIDAASPPPDDAVSEGGESDAEGPTEGGGA
ncbi:MAG: hypothetical protein HYV09_17630 [Deltaproteobacteria bacterium]|nr:hypothetical protein [Deltaproteobacteria bacterium]